MVGPDGELAASLRYLSQRFAMPDQKAKATLNDIGTEELAHLEMVGTIVHQLTEGLCPEEIKSSRIRCILYRPWGRCISTVSSRSSIYSSIYCSKRRSYSKSSRRFSSRTKSKSNI